MKLLPSLKLRRSQVLTPEEFEQLRLSALVLEQDGRGIKVMQLENGNIFKIFRRRHTISLSQIYSYARLFCRNADRLKALAIPTVDIIQLFHFEDSSDTGVLYKPLPGRTLRQLGMSGQLDLALLQAFGAFVARLHHEGVYFRSLHFGNVVLTPEGSLGLIDIADLKLRGQALRVWHRRRNFRHLQRYASDWSMISAEGKQAFAASYFAASELPAKAVARLRQELRFMSKE